MDVDRTVFHAGTQQADAAMGLFGRNLSVPLKRRLGFRHEKRTRNGNFHAAPSFRRRCLFRAVVGSLGQTRNAFYVLVGLGRQSNHEVELATTPTGGESRVYRAEQIVFSHALVNDIAQALSARLGGKRQPAALAACHKFGHFHTEGIESLAGDGNRNALSIEAAIQAAKDFFDLAVVGRRKRRKAHLVVARFRKTSLNCGNNIVCRAFAHGAIHHACLAKTAAARAAAQNLDIQAIVDQFGERHDRRLPCGRLGKALPDALINARRNVVEFGTRPCSFLLSLGFIEPIVKRRHIDALDMRCGAQEFLARRARALHAPMQLQYLGQRLLAFAQEEQIEKRRERFSIKRARTTCHDKGKTFIAVCAAQRNIRQIEQFKHVGSHELMRKRDADGVEFVKGGAAFKGKSGNAFAAHEINHVGRRKIASLGIHAFHGIDHVAQYAHRLIRLSQFIRVGIDHAEMIVRILFVRASPFMIEIACGAHDIAARIAKQGLDTRPKILHASPYRLLKRPSAA